jgi:hypothetical protein
VNSEEGSLEEGNSEERNSEEGSSEEVNSEEGSLETRRSVMDQKYKTEM